MNIGGINSVFGPIYNQQSCAYRKQNQEFSLEGASFGGHYIQEYSPTLDYRGRQEEYDAISMSPHLKVDENGETVLGPNGLPVMEFDEGIIAKSPILGMCGTLYPGGNGCYYDADGNHVYGVIGATSANSSTASRASAEEAPDTATRQWLDENYSSLNESELIDNIMNQIREVLEGSAETTREEYAQLLEEGSISETDYYRGLASLAERQRYQLQSYANQLESLDLTNSADCAILSSISSVLEAVDEQAGIQRAFSILTDYSEAMRNGASDEYAAFVGMATSRSSIGGGSTGTYGNSNPLVEMINAYREYLFAETEENTSYSDWDDAPWTLHRTDRGNGLLFVDQNGDGVASPEDGEIISGLSLEERDSDGDGVADDNYVDQESLDTNGDGKISGAEWDGVKLWYDSNGDGVSTADEVVDYSEALQNAGTLMGSDSRQAVRTYDMDAESDWPYHAIGSNNGLGVAMEYLDPNSTNYYTDANGEKQTFGSSSFVKLMHSLCASKLAS